MRWSASIPFAAVAGAVLAASLWNTDAAAEGPEHWPAPFGGQFNANFTVASDYSFAGISNTQLGPAFQVGMDYRSPDLIDGFPLWFFATGFGSNVSFAASGPGVEIDVGAGFKMKAFDKKLSVDLSYVRYIYPGTPVSFAYDYGEIVASLAYNFDLFELAGRLRYSPNSFGGSGDSWNKRALLTVPLDFIKLGGAKFKAYGSIGNIWVERFRRYGLPSQDYWYWQTGLVTSVFGLDLTIAYTDTSIDPAGCGNTAYCSGRVFVSLTKSF